VSTATTDLDALLAERLSAGERFFTAEADRLARLCHQLAERFARGGRLIAFADAPGPRSDARHVAVEFVHPVIVGKRALPALALTGDGSPLADQMQLLAGADDIAIAFGDGSGVAQALATARRLGCLTLGFAATGAEHAFLPPTDDPDVAQELVETLYHVLWEREDKLEPVVQDVRASVLMKAEETAALRAQTLSDNRDALVAAAAQLRARFEAGGKVLAFGNGGSATDAVDLVADLRMPVGGGPPRPAIDLTEDTGIITAVANDIGTDAIFMRQVIAYGQPGDAVVALSTSGNSGNVIAALAEARRRELLTVALVGYDGGRVASDGLADHVIVTRSDHIPRIQEAQATAYHALRRLVG
jgi:D-sedoheptulose 7-phosphate isomerase